MAGNDSIQFARATHEVITTSEEVALDGQPIFDTTNNKLFVGNGTDGLKNLKSVYANYDLIIDNQDKFNKYFKATDTEFVKAESVLILPMSTQYVYDNKTPTTLPTATKIISGLGNVKIELHGVIIFPTTPLTIENIYFDITHGVSLGYDSTFNGNDVGTMRNCTFYLDNRTSPRYNVLSKFLICENCLLQYAETLDADIDGVTFIANSKFANNIKVEVISGTATSHVSVASFCNYIQAVTNGSASATACDVAIINNAIVCNAIKAKTQFSNGDWKDVAVGSTTKVYNGHTYEVQLIIGNSGEEKYTCDSIFCVNNNIPISIQMVAPFSIANFGAQTLCWVVAEGYPGAEGSFDVQIGYRTVTYHQSGSNYSIGNTTYLPFRIRELE